MKIISWNVNGLRAVYKKNFLNWLEKSKADIVCLQEIKAQEQDLPKELIKIKNYYSFFNPAQRPGYSGVAVYSKVKPVKIEKSIGLKRFDDEGRILQLEYPEFTLINIYIPHGGRQKENLKYKLEVYKYLFNTLKKLQNKKVILIGDLNIAHTELDLARPKNNMKNIMFTAEEREQIDQIIKLGFIDTFRAFHKLSVNYTWWPYRLNARKRNIGWRIDYTFISKKLRSKLKDAYILSKVEGSDHCPIGIEI